MQDISDLIINKISSYPESIQELARASIALGEKGLSDNTIAEHLGNIVRQIVKKEINNK